jgi:cobalt-zinc-cadmium efflux system protein
MHDGHNHSHSIPIAKIKKAFVVGIALNLVFVIIEATSGFIVNSLSLIADAGHNLADVGALALSLLALKLSEADSSEKFTYGLGKVSVLAALLNSIVLLVSVGIISYEAIHRFNNPRELSGSAIAIVAGVGIIINGFTAYLFFHERESDLNVKSSYWHLVADTLVSLGVVIGGICIYFFNWYWIDSVLSLGVAAIILMGSWQVFRESALLGLDAVPQNVKL